MRRARRISAQENRPGQANFLAQQARRAVRVLTATTTRNVATLIVKIDQKRRRSLRIGAGLRAAGPQGHESTHHIRWNR